jgi:hypothetical protein
MFGVLQLLVLLPLTVAVFDNTLCKIQCMSVAFQLGVGSREAGRQKPCDSDQATADLSTATKCVLRGLAAGQGSESQYQE